MNKMDASEIKLKIIEGNKLALKRLVEKKKENASPLFFPLFLPINDIFRISSAFRKTL